MPQIAIENFGSPRLGLGSQCVTVGTMAVRVTFPGGEVREVPSKRVTLQEGKTGTQNWSFREQPIYDPAWAFIAVKDGWVAVAR